MTDLREQIDALKFQMNSLIRGRSAQQRGDAAWAAIEAALFPEPGPAPDPTKQFVAGETYKAHDGRVRECLFVFLDGSMGSMDGPCLSTSVPFTDGDWKHVPRNPELDAAIAERDAAKASLAAAQARVAELGGE